MNRFLIMKAGPVDRHFQRPITAMYLSQARNIEEAACEAQDQAENERDGTLIIVVDSLYVCEGNMPPAPTV